MFIDIPYAEICLIREINVSDAKMIDVKTTTPSIKTSIICFRMNLSRIVNLKKDFITKF